MQTARVRGSIEELFAREGSCTVELLSTYPHRQAGHLLFMVLPNRIPCRLLLWKTSHRTLLPARGISPVFSSTVDSHLPRQSLLVTFTSTSLILSRTVDSHLLPSVTTRHLGHLHPHPLGTRVERPVGGHHRPSDQTEQCHQASSQGHASRVTISRLMYTPFLNSNCTVPYLSLS